MTRCLIKFNNLTTHQTFKKLKFNETDRQTTKDKICVHFVFFSREKILALTDHESVNDITYLYSTDASHCFHYYFLKYTRSEFHFAWMPRYYSMADHEIGISKGWGGGGIVQYKYVYVLHAVWYCAICFEFVHVQQIKCSNYNTLWWSCVVNNQDLKHLLFSYINIFSLIYFIFPVAIHV